MQLPTKHRLLLAAILFTTSLASAAHVVPWTWQQSACRDCGVIFQISNENFKKNAQAYEFIKTLTNEKNNIVNLYGSDPQEYNLLAHMAVGILGNESTYFEGLRYQVKSNTQLAIQWTKQLKAWFGGYEASPNSKGPTQIKRVPERIKQFYNITEDNLWEPHSAAVSTMGFLIEALSELKNRAYNNGLEFITPETYVDYLPYIYFGGAKKLITRTATPDTNIYVKNMKLHMNFVTVFEVVPDDEQR